MTLRHCRPVYSAMNDVVRKRMQDLKPYAFVDALDELRGPFSGMLEMSHSVC